MNMFIKRYLQAFGQELPLASRVVLLMFTVGVYAISPAKAGLKGDAELLKLTAMTHKDNRERIHTWRGYVQVEQIHKDANGVIVQEKNSIHFLFGKKQNAVRWKRIPVERHLRKQGQLVPDDDEWLGTINAMMKGDAFYNYSPGIITPQGERLNTLVIWPRAKTRKYSYVESFHPMWYLTGHMTKCTDDLAERLMFFYREAKKRELRGVTVTRDGERVILELSGEVALNHFEFDLSKGGNIVKLYAEGKKGTELRQWTYEEKDGVWVPKTFAFELQYNSPDSHGVTSWIRKVTFVENILNRPIPDSEFSLEKLGVKVGTRVTDRIRGLFYIYDGTEELPLQD